MSLISSVAACSRQSAVLVTLSCFTCLSFFCSSGIPLVRLEDFFLFHPISGKRRRCLFLSWRIFSKLFVRFPSPIPPRRYHVSQLGRPRLLLLRGLLRGLRLGDAGRLDPPPQHLLSTSSKSSVFFFSQSIFFTFSFKPDHLGRGSPERRLHPGGARHLGRGGGVRPGLLRRPPYDEAEEPRSCGGKGQVGKTLAGSNELKSKKSVLFRDAGQLLSLYLRDALARYLACTPVPRCDSVVEEVRQTSSPPASGVTAPQTTSSPRAVTGSTQTPPSSSSTTSEVDPTFFLFNASSPQCFLSSCRMAGRSSASQQQQQHQVSRRCPQLHRLKL